LINEDEFNPKSIIAFDWELIIPPNLSVYKDFSVEFICDPNIRSRAINLIDMKPEDWPENKEGFLDHLPPRKCYVHGRDDGEAMTLDDKFMVDISGDSVRINKRGSEYRGNNKVLYDPDAEQQEWQVGVLDRIKSAVARYEKFCEDRFGIASIGAGGNKPMDYAHLTSAEKTSICDEFDKIDETVGTMNRIDRIAQKRCTSTKAWHRMQGKNMRAAILLVLVEGSKIKLS